MVVGMKELKDGINYLLLVLITGVMTYGVNTLSDLNKNVAQLNTQVAILIQQNANAEKRIEKLESKVFNN
jgi:cell division protein FtsB